MKEKHVASLEPAKRMKELGFPQKSDFYWTRKSGQPNWRIADETEIIPSMDFSAYHVGELGDMLRKRTKSALREIDFGGNHTHFWARETYDSHNGEFFSEQNEADPRAKMLIYLAEKGIIEPKEITL